MQVKLLLPVVEGTTSLSNVFKSLHSKQTEATTRNIAIRKFNVGEDSTQNQEPPLESILAEREQEFEIERQSLEDEKRLVENLKEKATEDIALMRTAWEEEKLQLQQQAYEEAFQAGFTEGREKVLSDMTTSIELANEVTEKSHMNAQQYQMSQERVILEIAMRAAGRILAETLEDDEEKFLSIVKRALKEVQEMKEIKLFVSTDYYKLVSDNRGELAAIFPPDVPFLIFLNEDFEATECYIETNHGRIVVSIDEQLTHLREQLIEIIESRD